ncbi:unnamed protein product [Amoebophrya sp. A25]|nr:unnamed protein product [Amoebophrya sp. A25]|eukprot:GSA25T00015385001.1
MTSSSISSPPSDGAALLQASVSRRSALDIMMPPGGGSSCSNAQSSSAAAPSSSSSLPSSSSLLPDTQHVISDRQEALWADAKIDGRAVFSKRESYKLHRRRLIALQADVERIRAVVRLTLKNSLTDTTNNGVDGTSTSTMSSQLYRYFGGDVGVLSHVAENLAEIGPAVGFFGQIYDSDLRGVTSHVEQQCDGASKADNVSMNGDNKSKRDQEEVGSSTSSSGSSTPTSSSSTFAKVPKSSKNNNIRLLLRKRPLLPDEIHAAEWDVVSRPELSTLLVHEGRVAYNGRRLQLQLSHHTADAILTGGDRLRGVMDFSNYNSASSGLLSSSTPTGTSSPISDSTCGPAQGSHTILCYGQTGTGKTFTMREIVDEILQDLQNQSDTIITSSSCEEVQVVEIQCFELLHKVAFDLLDGRKQVKILEDASRTVHVKAKWVRCAMGMGADVKAKDGSSPAGGENNTSSAGQSASDVEDARTTIDHALALRLSEATERNVCSSRSHAFFMFRIGGRLIRVIDLAGSERNFETQAMTAAQHRQSALINSSLMTLKTCLRMLASASAENHRRKIPFRDSRLTHLLQDCFVGTTSKAITSQEAPPEDVAAVGSLPQHKQDQEQPSSQKETFPTSTRMTIIATVSPCARDAIHSRNTLSHVCDMVGRASPSCVLDLPLELFYQEINVCKETGKAKPIELWSEEDVQKWLGQVAGGRFARIVLPEKFRDGKGLLFLTEMGTQVAHGRGGCVGAVGRQEEGSSSSQGSAQGRFFSTTISQEGSSTSSSSSKIDYPPAHPEALGGGGEAGSPSRGQELEGDEEETARSTSNASRNELFEVFANDQMRRARVNEEGASWNIQGPEQMNKILEMFCALVRVEVNRSEKLRSH